MTTALAAGALIAVVPHARADGDDAQAGVAAIDAGGSCCTGIPPGYGHPPVNLTPLALQLTQPLVEPVPATDGLIHLPYAAQVTNTRATPADICQATCETHPGSTGETRPFCLAGERWNA